MSTLETVLVKSPHKSEFYSEEHLQEFMKCTDPISGPKYFLENYFYIQHPTKGKLQYVPFDYQKELLHNYHAHRFSINLCGRQLGKCVRGETTMINIRNKNTGEELEISIVDFYKMQENNSRK